MCVVACGKSCGKLSCYSVTQRSMLRRWSPGIGTTLGGGERQNLGPAYLSTINAVVTKGRKREGDSSSKEGNTLDSPLDFHRNTTVTKGRNREGDS
ncbi:hypothetical protein AMTR_s00154p00093540 [Amborella trichopoda]|uniref:Uncharacterized protein n=1 Tax=Amborella trichopoda TaxID=13333 RepID=W1PHT8_AMBTC|nr:hypothetical protein AMTR_s00154p00093540 [Amborella trichopoda]